MTASKLRANIYRILDEVVETGVPVEIERNGEIIQLIPKKKPPSKLSKLEPHPNYIIGDPEDLVHLDWSKEWRP